MSPKKDGKSPKWMGVLRDRSSYAQTLADLLRKEHTDSGWSIKTIMRETGASESSVKGWLYAQHGPSALFFLRLVTFSPAIRDFLEKLLEHPAAQNSEAQTPHSKIPVEAQTMEESFSQIWKGGAYYDPKGDLGRASFDEPEQMEINARQHWFLCRIAEGFRCDANQIIMKWSVSLATARRDIKFLRNAGLLEFVGSRRKGRYRLML